MARIFKPRYAVRRTVTGPDGTKRYAPVLDKQGKPVYRETANWYVETRVNGRLKKVPGYTDKAATLQLAAELERNEAHRASGLKTDVGDGLLRPLAEHLEDWRNLLRAKRTRDYADKQHTRAKAVIDGCGFDLWKQIDQDKVELFLAGLREDKNDKRGLSKQTADAYLQACKQFLKWMAKSKRAPFSPLAFMDRDRGMEDSRRLRRAWTDAELVELVEYLQTAPELYGMTGETRAMVYRLAAGSGLRLNEIRTLTPEAFYLDDDEPYIHLKGANTKNRKQADQLINPALAEDLKPFVKATLAGQRVFPIPEDRKAFSARIMQVDMDEARKAWIAKAPAGKARKDRERSSFLMYCNAVGEYADFHALRHTYCSKLGEMGLPVKDIQELARHSSPTLSMRYVHTTRPRLVQAVGRLPNAKPQKAPAAATDVA